MARYRLNFYQFLLNLLLQFPARNFAIRRDVSLQEKHICRTTVQGRYLLSDDNGHVCDALSVDPWSRCCPQTGEKFSCQGCNHLSQCCNSYEFCVSCCLNPSRTQKELALKVKIAKPMTAGTYTTVFDFCCGRCRHNSESVVHENAYSSDFHHCFSLPSNSSGTVDTNLEASLAGINIVIGRQGESCNSVCRSKGQSCVPNKLLVLNKCELWHMKRGRTMWRGLRAALCWTLWEEINTRIFLENERGAEELRAVIHIRAVQWLKSLELFSNYTVEDMLRKWGEIANCTQVKPIIRVSWTPPPAGFLKLNFDGSCRGNPGQSGIGGVFRDENGESEVVIGWLIKDDCGLWNYRNEKRKFRWLVREMEIRMSWVKRSAKSLADGLAKQGIEREAMFWA